LGILKTSHIKYFIKKRNENNQISDKKVILDDVNIDIEQGDFVAILGHNGSGKSTLAKHLNALLLPDDGKVYIDGKTSDSIDELWKLREICGMVFQNPDNQIVGVTVEEDVGFGPENLGISYDEIWKRVDEALDKVNMKQYRKKSPNHLSGGQKQRVAIASSLAMKPKCIVLDEPTAMLDPSGRKEVMAIVSSLNKREKMTIILITHHMNEAIMANKVLVMDKGKVVLNGTPRDVFANVEEIKRLKLDMPQAMELSFELYREGIFSRYDILSKEEFIEEFTKCSNGKCSNDKYRNEKCSNDNDGEIFNKSDVELGKKSNVSVSEKDNVSVSEKDNASVSEKDNVSLSEKDSISLSEKDSVALCKKSNVTLENNERVELLRMENVSLLYEQGTDMQVKALDNINLTIYEKELIGIIGHTGSGKSSLIQTMNGLLKATEGNIYYRGRDISAKDFNKKELHCNVGIVFQYPESQLFEETVLKDVMFGPMNKGLSEEKAKDIAINTLKELNIGEEVFENTPFELSGGEKRRVAIAGVMAMEPDIIILDEPTAGLDPQTRNELLDTLEMLNREKQKTILIVSHSMEDMAKYVDRIIVMNDGRIAFDDTKRNVFENSQELLKMGLDIPDVTYIMRELKKCGYNVDDRAITVEEAKQQILGMWSGE
jgi:energy-coupling factor transport system ATP-binding protein